MKRRKGEVRLAGELVGTIEELEGDVRFAYSREWLERDGAVPSSVTRPLRPKAGYWRFRAKHSRFPKMIPLDCFLRRAAIVLVQ